jgi:fumarate hydratase class II
MLVTALAPEIGYDAAAALAKEAFASGRTIRDLARERTSLSETELDRILDPAAMVDPGRSFASAG